MCVRASFLLSSESVFEPFSLSSNYLQLLERESSVFESLILAQNDLIYERVIKWFNGKLELTMAHYEY